MSYALKKAAQVKFEETANELMRQLIERTGDTHPQMVLKQGEIRGLKLASDLLDEAMKELLGE